jgi:hypothetical protein
VGLDGVDSADAKESFRFCPRGLPRLRDTSLSFWTGPLRLLFAL